MTVEQQIEETPSQETTTDDAAGGEATRDELIAVAREAAAGAETGAAVVEQPATPDPNDPTEKINSVMRAREAAHAKRIEADDYFAAQRRAADEERTRILEEARAEAKRIAAEDLAALKAQYRGSPTAALRSLAENPQDVVDAVLREGTPEARALAQVQEDARLAREEAKAGKSAADEIRAELKKFNEQRDAERVSAFRQSFLDSHASADKAPYMHARWDPIEVFDRCNAQCTEWQKDGLKLGIDFDQDTLVAYLEKQSKERYLKLPGTPAQQSGAGGSVKSPGIAPKSAANGTRTITAASSSERRASPRAFNDLTPEEQREDLIAVAREAMRQHGKA